jgi:hypothetical protein
VGDRIRVGYHESIALSPRRPIDSPEIAAVTVAGRSPDGGKPTRAVVEAAEVFARVLVIETRKRTASLNLLDGSQVATPIESSAQTLDGLKSSHSIPARYTELVAISVEQA